MHDWLTGAVRSVDPNGAIEGLYRTYFRGPGLLVDQDQMALAGGLGLEAPAGQAAAADDASLLRRTVYLGAKAAQDLRSRVLQQPAVAGGGVAGQGEGQGLADLQALWAFAFAVQFDGALRLLGASGEQGQGGGNEQAREGHVGS
ncbi:hypothetical protein EMIT047CA2_80245 [Pseudomonas soli]